MEPIGTSSEFLNDYLKRDEEEDSEEEDTSGNTGDGSSPEFHGRREDMAMVDSSPLKHDETSSTRNDSSLPEKVQDATDHSGSTSDAELDTQVEGDNLVDNGESDDPKMLALSMYDMREGEDKLSDEFQDEASSSFEQLHPAVLTQDDIGEEDLILIDDLTHDDDSEQTNESESQEEQDGSTAGVHSKRNLRPRKSSPHSTADGLDLGGDSEWRRRLMPPKLRLKNRKHLTAAKERSSPKKASASLNKVYMRHFDKNYKSGYKCRFCDQVFDENNFAEHTKEKCEAFSAGKPTCVHCKHTFNQSQSLMRHIREIHSKEKPYKCDQCGKAFTINSALIKHARTHSGEMPFECDVCEKPFRFKCNLRIHKRIHTDDKRFQCQICGKMFIAQSQRDAHQKKHVAGTTEMAPRKRRGKTGYGCRYCVLDFKDLEEWLEHQPKHKEDRLFRCPQCDKVFAKLENRERHLLTHSSEKPHQCSYCGKGFTMARYLQSHERIHTGDRPFKCNICDKAFYYSNDLIKHKRTHTGDRPYQCEECGKAYSTNGQLTIHKRVHSGERPYACDFCELTFTSSRALRTHKKRHGNKNFQCEACDLSFYTKGELKHHSVRKHPNN